MDLAMRKRFIVTAVFDAWTPGEREYPISHVEMRPPFEVFADLDTEGEGITFSFDNLSYEADRKTFLAKSIRKLRG
jgi:hypothetical protein